MAYCALLLLILTVSKAAVEECSNQQPGGSGVLDLQQVTTIPYCSIDECTIKSINTGQQLDIIYTTDSVLVVTPAGNQTSMAIAKNEDQRPCVTTVAESTTIEYLGLAGTAIAIAIVTGYILLVHLLYKELRNVFGKLLMLYNGALFFQCIIAAILMTTHFQVPTNSQIACQVIFFSFMQGDMAIEVFATGILAYLVYMAYLSSRLQNMSPSMSKRIFRYSLAYSTSLLFLFGFIIAVYDFATGDGKYTILPNGHCNYIASEYSTMLIARVNTSFNKLAQLLLFAIYLFYFCKLRNGVSDASTPARKPDRYLTKIAISMGGAVGISEFIWMIEQVVGITYIGVVAVIALFIQQCIIMTSFLYFKRMSKLCREVCKKDTSP